MVLVGLTGGIGAGKSTVAQLLVGRGAVLVDADAIAREIVEPGRPTLRALADRFGDEIIDAEGALRRQALADVAFASDEGKQALNDITWPAIAAEMRHQVDAAPRDAVVVCDAALLLEGGFGLAGEYEAVVVVEAPLEARLDRLEVRGLRRDDAARRIAAQMSDDERRDFATFVLDNSGSIGDLEPQVDALWKTLERITSGNA
jgi:dephospho-CoA kinase